MSPLPDKQGGWGTVAVGSGKAELFVLGGGGILSHARQKSVILGLILGFPNQEAGLLPP